LASIHFAVAVATAFPLIAAAQEAPPEAVRSLGTVTVTGGQPTSLPTQIPTTIEGVTREQIDRSINASDSYQADKNWSTAFGIDNLNNAKYWNFHPYPQRAYSAELKYDL
jgi:outer membrane receptor protein involved in Fe transport